VADDKPLSIEEQIINMKKYVSFTQKTKMREFIGYTGYFRASRYGKYLLSFSGTFAKKPSQEQLFELYAFDFELRKLMFESCMKAEIQIKSNIANAVSLKTEDATFYLNSDNYTPTRGERIKVIKKKNIVYYENFFNQITQNELNLRSNNSRYPELKEYRNGGKRAYKNIPCWAAFSYFELGIIENIYKYLRSDLRKEVLSYGYSRGKYGKRITNQMDTWIDGIRTLRNICAHNSQIVGMQESIVSLDLLDEQDILKNGEDLFSRIYALKKILKPKDSEELIHKLQKLIKKTKINIYQMNILPKDWEDRFNRIKYL
jgi:abortive infection bacteriophage resistance protein